MLQLPCIVIAKKKKKTKLIEYNKDTFGNGVNVVLHLLCPKPIYSLGKQNMFTACASVSVRSFHISPIYYCNGHIVHAQ